LAENRQELKVFMTTPAPLVEIWRGDLCESLHFGHAVICDGRGEIHAQWGDPNAVIYPRSACKMIQALPLVASGAADRYGLTQRQLALSCASHNGAEIHTRPVQAWLTDLGLAEPDLRCGPQPPNDAAAREALRAAGARPCQIHNNCSGKHAGFLTLSSFYGGGPDYIEIDHPVQQACQGAMEDTTDRATLGYALDGCSAPNFATTVHGLARAMAWFAGAAGRSDAQSRAADRLVQAMMVHPELVAGEGRACTVLMRAMQGRAAVKTGAEGVFVAILPGRGLGVALKITDGATRASECAIGALLIRLGVLNAEDPAAQTVVGAPIRNRRKFVTGHVRPAAGLM